MRGTGLLCRAFRCSVPAAAAAGWGDVLPSPVVEVSWPVEVVQARVARASLLLSPLKHPDQQEDDEDQEKRSATDIHCCLLCIVTSA
ncbi:MAG: hypothetical protein QOG89_2311 [Thermomicrobiales bacterium]|nr:hypothetical protein [Thermomicrobiales bacterium]